MGRCVLCAVRACKCIANNQTGGKMMEVEFKIESAGLVKAGKLHPGDTFVEGGLMNTPRVYWVMDTCFHRPEKKENCVQAMNVQKNEMRCFDFEKLVARVDCKLVVLGYTDPRTPRDF
jgi:hypothetical protein